jgi:hypothetical protein
LKKLSTPKRVSPHAKSGRPDRIGTRALRRVLAAIGLLGGIPARGKTGGIGLYFGGTKKQAERLAWGSFSAGKTDI